MINYKLALKLKKAEFPTTKDTLIRGGKNLEFGEFLPFPTLSELIEACGEKFQGIDTYKKEKRKVWRAWKIIEGEKYKDRYVLSGTPEEAMAKLWLKLNL